MNDGSIRVSTKIDTSGAKTDLVELEKEVQKTAEKIVEAGKKINTTFTGMSAKQLESAIAKANKELEKTLALQEELESKADAIQASYDPLYNDSSNEAQRQILDEMAQHELEPINQQWSETNEKVKEIRQNISAMESELQRVREAEEASARAAEASARSEAEKKQATKEAEKAAKAHEKAEREAAAAARRTSREITRGFSQGIKRATRLALSVLGIRGAYMALRRAASTYLEQNEELKNQLNSIWNVLGTALGPVIQQLVSWLTTAITYINAFVKALTGVDLIAKANAAALKKQTDATKKAAAAAKSLASFDEINKLSDSSSSSSESGASSGTFAAADIGNFDPSPIIKTIEDISAIIGVSLLALGALLAFSGVNIPLGLGLMAAGAATLAAEAALNWDELSGNVADKFDVIATLIAGSALVIGAILAFSGANVPLGIGLMIAGAAGLAGEAAINWNSTTNECKEAITGIMSAAGAALLALGAILAFSGANIPLGIGLMAAGALALGSAVALNWNSLKDDTSATVTTISAVVGGALLGVGAVLAFSGVNIALGIGLMAAGAVGLAAAIAPNWNGLSDDTKNTIYKISAIAGGALLAIGLILCLTGAGIPLGLGMMAAGGASLATAIAPNWDAIKSKIKDVLGAIGGFFSDCWEGITNGFKAFVNVIIGGINFLIGGINKLIDGINKVSFDFPDWIPGIGGETFGINIPRIKEIPKLARGGIVNNPGRGIPVIAGEAGAEAILPLDQNTGWMDILAEKIGGFAGKIVIPIYLNGKKIAEEVIDLNNSRKFATNGAI